MWHHQLPDGDVHAPNNVSQEIYTALVSVCYSSHGALMLSCWSRMVNDCRPPRLRTFQGSLRVCRVRYWKRQKGPSRNSAPFPGSTSTSVASTFMLTTSLARSLSAGQVLVVQVVILMFQGHCSVLTLALSRCIELFMNNSPSGVKIGFWLMQQRTCIDCSRSQKQCVNSCT